MYPFNKLLKPVRLQTSLTSGLILLHLRQSSECSCKRSFQELNTESEDEEERGVLKHIWIWFALGKEVVSVLPSI